MDYNTSNKVSVPVPELPSGSSRDLGISDADGPPREAPMQLTANGDPKCPACFCAWNDPIQGSFTKTAVNRCARHVHYGCRNKPFGTCCYANEGNQGCAPDLSSAETVVVDRENKKIACLTCATRHFKPGYQTAGRKRPAAACKRRPAARKRRAHP
jgi:hypothetical protein